MRKVISVLLNIAMVVLAFYAYFSFKEFTSKKIFASYDAYIREQLSGRVDTFYNYRRYAIVVKFNNYNSWDTIYCSPNVFVNNADSASMRDIIEMGDSIYKPSNSGEILLFKDKAVYKFNSMIMN